jgi:S-adenosylmethionine hydrolase
MKRIIDFASIVALTSIAIAACAPSAEQIANAEEGDSDNALLIQADFAGLVMTGVARSVSKDLDIYNVRPLIPLYDIRAASASMAYNAQTWPAGTVFVSVVDPGVGTDRKSVVLKTKNGLYFVSPDNGSLSGPATQYGIEAVREIDETVNRIPGSDWSHTFHGRDVYSYTGARLAAGVITYEEVGPLMKPEVIMLEELGARLEDGVLYGYVSGGTGRLGNISFSIDRHLFEEINPVYGEIYDVVIRNRDEIAWEGSLPYAKSFGDVRLGDNLLFVNSSGDTSIAVNQGSFANKYGIGEGDSWTIEIRKQ